MRIALALALLAAGLTGCGDRELPGGTLTPEVRALLAHVPGDSKVVAGIDLAQARSSGLWDRALADPVPDLLAVGHRCGINLVTEVDRVVMSSPDQQPDIKRVHFVVSGRFTESGKSCLNEIAMLREANASWAGAVAIVSPSSLVPASSPVTASPEMLARIEKADTTGVVWIAADTRGASPVRLPMPAELHGVVLSLRPQGDGVAAVARLELDTEDRARATANLFRENRDSLKKALPDPRLGDILGRIDVIQQGRELAFQVSVDRAELDHLLAMKAMLGAGP